ncbi:MAG: 16S rRNA (adenine(1518)-N(6)/adenine(1519)-N(6))-dimethyltransferase RsmA [Candidatus Dormibacteraceae bacterium]
MTRTNAPAAFRPRHSLGQNFLVDADLRRRVVEAAGITSSDQVLEIGAGPGTLTAELCLRAERVVAIEIDRRLIPALRVAAPAAEVVQGDILRLDLSALFPSGGEVVVGNIPYYLSGALIRRLLDWQPRPRRLSLVVQRELARRWCGIGGWSLSTVAVQFHTRARLALDLPASAFEPVPRVDSALVVMEVREHPAIEVGDPGAFLRFVEAVFQFRRKQLKGALSRVLQVSPEVAGTILAEAAIEPQQRAQTLTLPDWERLARSVSPYAGAGKSPPQPRSARSPGRPIRGI